MMVVVVVVVVMVMVVMMMAMVMVMVMAIVMVMVMVMVMMSMVTLRVMVIQMALLAVSRASHLLHPPALVFHRQVVGVDAWQLALTPPYGQHVSDMRVSPDEKI